MVDKKYVPLNDQDDITILLLGSKESIKNLSELRAFLKGMCQGEADRFLEFHEGNLAEMISYMKDFQKKIESEKTIKG